MERKRVVILGAAGRDFHDFNMVYRDNPKYEVVAFTATQIPGIASRVYPKELAGKLYPKGIPIYAEEDLPEIVKKFKVDKVILAYSDLPYFHVMHKASQVLALGADFGFLGPKATMLKSRKSVISVCAVRTGCGKSQTTRMLCYILKKAKRKVVVVRHPMAYGNLVKEIVQRFEKYDDLEKQKCTIEEREEYEPLIDIGVVVYAGVDYKKILHQAEKEADIIIWDGGNNDFPFFKPNLHIVLTDPLRAGHEISYYPGEINLRMADVVIINKQKSASKENIELVRKNVKKYNPKALIIDANSEIKVSNPELVKNKRVLVVEDGPTLTHGEMPYGAGTIAAHQLKAKIVDPREFAIGSIKAIFEKYPHLDSVLPAMGYSAHQIKELERTINSAKCDAVISGTPIDLRRILKVDKPIVRISYELKELGWPNLEYVLKKFKFI